MRRIVVLTFMTLDGVMQAPGGPEEDPTSGFQYGGWSVGYWDDVMGKIMGEQMGHEFDLLLGRNTYDTFAAAWPKIDPKSAINSCRKYVVTHRSLPEETQIWKNSVRIDGDVVGKIRRLKADDGPEIQVHGSASLIQTLLKEDLVDELWLKIYPVTVGGGKRLFAEGTIAAGFELTDCKASPKGVIVASYRRAGAIQTGSFAPTD
ncbi:MAG TPA: dihydrofolate reductase family protein [Spirochaetia bacterium]|nr:dihydrofolate reductase family protein [Spirochaetia bacterium]